MNSILLLVSFLQAYIENAQEFFVNFFFTRFAVDQVLVSCFNCILKNNSHKFFFPSIFYFLLQVCTKIPWGKIIDFALKLCSHYCIPSHCYSNWNESNRLLILDFEFIFSYRLTKYSLFWTSNSFWICCFQL